MITASIHRVPRLIVLLALLALCIWPAPDRRVGRAFAQSGCAAPTSMPPAAPAQPAATGAIGLIYRASLGGDTAAAAPSGSRLALSRGADLGVFDPLSARLDLLHMNARVEDIVAGQSALYVAAGPGGLLMVNADATARIGALAVPGLAAAVALAEPYAYLAAAGPGGGLLAVDVGDPASPRLLDGAPTYGSAEDLAVAGGRAYVAEGLAGGIEIFDLANPAAPTLRGALVTPGAARGVAVDGARAYIAGGPCGLQVVDVSDPASPRLLGAVPTIGEARAVRVAGGRAYVAADSAGLQVFELSGAAPRLVASRSFGPLAPVGDVELAGATAALAAGPAGAIAVNIADPALPTIVEAPTLGGVRAALASGGDVYLALGDGGLAAVGAALDDTLIGSLRRISAPALGLALGPSVAGKVTLYSAGGATGLGVIQGAPGGALTLLRTLSLPGSTGAVLVAGDTAYAAAGAAGVHVLDLTDPLSPTLTRTVDTPGAALDIALSGGRLYVADRDGMRVIDPAAGAIVGGYNAPAGAFVRGVAAAGGLAYLADRDGLIVLDVSDPAKPALIRRIAGFSLYNLAIQGATLFAAAGKDGALAFDLGDPAAPRLAGRYDTPGTALGVTPDSDSLLVADSEGGMLRLGVLALPYQAYLPLVGR